MNHVGQTLTSRTQAGDPSTEGTWRRSTALGPALHAGANATCHPQARGAGATPLSANLGSQGLASCAAGWPEPTALQRCLGGSY